MSAKERSGRTYEPVDASPVKSFFVTMLTRDITLADAILDLLDNCVDGILRKQKKPAAPQPYSGFFADIKFNAQTFEIHDNCGGIPWKLSKYAFRMGRPEGREDNVKGTVGTYGIGMKRAIFKMGRECLISTQSAEDKYDVEISTEWITNEEEWKIPVHRATKSMADDGTTIVIGSLHPGIALQFSHDQASFVGELTKKIETHYAFIIAKGFKVSVNGSEVKARPTELAFAEKSSKAIRPYIYKADVDGVQVFLAVGFTRPIPSQEDVIAEQDNPTSKYSSLDAGWTVICNDRAVVYCDKTALTGWGEAGIAQYHQQFIAISGIVEFRSADPRKLPTTTTKRGIDASSPLYLEVKNRMREGMKIFIDYTNKWKKDVKEAKAHISDTERLSFEQIKSRKISFTPAKRGIQGHLYKPVLPRPKQQASSATKVTFVKELREIKIVAQHLFGDDDVAPKKVGEACFDIVLEEAKK